eukprot:1315276-Amphidinium_carterae.2
MPSVISFRSSHMLHAVASLFCISKLRHRACKNMIGATSQDDAINPLLFAYVFYPRPLFFFPRLSLQVPGGELSTSDQDAVAAAAPAVLAVGVQHVVPSVVLLHVSLLPLLPGSAFGPFSTVPGPNNSIHVHCRSLREAVERPFHDNFL